MTRRLWLILTVPHRGPQQVRVTMPWGVQDVFIRIGHPLDGLHSTAMHSRAQICLAKALWPLQLQYVICGIIPRCLSPCRWKSQGCSTPHHTHTAIFTYIPLSNTFFRQRHRRQEEIVTAPVKQPRDQPGPRNPPQPSINPTPPCQPPLGLSHNFYQKVHRVPGYSIIKLSVHQRNNLQDAVNAILGSTGE